jgi:hypothetical protein
MHYGETLVWYLSFIAHIELKCIMVKTIGNVKTITNIALQASEDAGTRGGRLDTGCDWRFSNLVPVAWDGVQNVLAVGERLQSPDLRYALVMQGDCNLVLYEKGADGKYEFNAKWAAYSQFNDPFLHNCSAVLQPNGNLVVMDPGGRPRWASNGTSSSWYTSALAVLRNGTVAVYEMNSGAVLWSTG